MEKYLEEMNIINAIIKAKFDRKINLYKKFSEKIKNYVITFVDEIYGIDNYKYMLDILKIDNRYIFSPFSTNKLLTLYPGFTSLNEPIIFFFDISLDTSIVSYVDKFQRGIELEDKPLEIVKQLNKHRKIASAVNLAPYINENCLLDSKINEIHRDNVYNFFYFFNKAHEKFKFIARIKSKKSTELLIKNQEMIFNSPMADKLKHQFKIIKSTLLKIAVLNLEHINNKKKILKLIDFMAKDIKSIDLYLLEIAAVYFLKKQNLSFFGKIQRKNTAIIDTINNLSWDIFHIRYQEFLLSIKPKKKIDINLVLFCTLDKRLLEIRNIVKLKAIVYNNETGNYYPFYENESVKKILSTDEIHNYFKPSMHIDRISTKIEIDYDKIIFELQNEVVESYIGQMKGFDNL